ncbi:hypothetical protein MTR_3g072490 [Medicago truncatula]|uniref:Uncharacterized protein n=1 Tax=Medicago truncatula TaxID=3880 RepID=G7J310_MEDTR|nr:hypothetical protein MTR_3g072490 [Medicago truncatula]
MDFVCNAIVTSNPQLQTLTEGKLVHLHMKNISFKHPTTLLANHLFPMHLCSSNYVHECCWIMKGARGTVHIEPRTTTQARETSLYSWNNILSRYVKLG